MLGREPAVLAAGLAAVLQGLVILLTGDSTIDAGTLWPWLVPALTALAGLITRQSVVPLKKYEDLERAARRPRRA